MCGESRMRRKSNTLLSGSPPHVWGKRTVLHLVRRGKGITPTCVGKAVPECARCPVLQDHPHMWGESPGRPVGKGRPRGSPPHVWGKLLWFFSWFFFYRITPTCVGKASAVLLACHPEEDHPHMCGESLNPYFNAPLTLGSPPHVWGKLVDLSFFRVSYRITPTWVGKAKWPIRARGSI